jgi:hypothetical protein
LYNITANIVKHRSLKLPIYIAAVSPALGF